MSPMRHDEGHSDAPGDAVRTAIEQWDGVSTHQHRFGGIEFRVGRRELGHLHRSIADLPFPRRERDELIAAGKARPHHVLPDSGWVTVPMRTTADVTTVIELFRRNYERRASRASHESTKTENNV
jgi:luciferase-like monooxygenase